MNEFRPNEVYVRYSIIEFVEGEKSILTEGPTSLYCRKVHHMSIFMTIENRKARQM